VENFLVSTRFYIYPIPPVNVDQEPEYEVGRMITAAPTITTLHQSRGDLFYKLKECIHRKELFLKGDDHDIHEYVDIQAILAQGFVVVPDELKQELGNFSN
jgi:hypothetical protein